jgi:hypothetical protein
MNEHQLSLFPGQVHEGRKTAVHQNSILAYYKEASKGKIRSIKKRIIIVLAKNGDAMTRRQLAFYLKKEPSSLCPATKELEKEGIIKIAFHAKCPTTGHKVSWFIIDKIILQMLTKPVE